MTTTEKEIDMTETTTGLPDPRPQLTAAQDWVAGLLAGVGPERYDRPTPCADFDVEALIRHLYGVSDRAIALGGGAPAESVPAMAAELLADVLGGYRDRTERTRIAWSDDASLARPVAAPWGTMPGAIVASVYVAEVLAHGWDLAVATGQDSEADPELASFALATMQRALPAQGREDYPFDAPVTPDADAGPTEQLANWLGRAR